ncbi:Cytochrome c oxidase assembly protein cox11, mitochondrial [Periplaneta americana]|uniref:Cytochrome c oxidase assembly protein cox11, mitochondrial n=1 Tax=Periplaneta americana TaxID=6978 RepID=A0ABQ8S1Y0_PERAM|nr:Cytochrome c oxidase assembly protein cox11, mitochondrial [Periplaneta americana]
MKDSLFVSPLPRDLLELWVKTEAVSGTSDILSKVCEWNEEVNCHIVNYFAYFFQAYSYGGTTGVGHDADKVEAMSKIRDRVISVRFNADTAASMRWNFKPQQAEIKVIPGETALAFYTACNPTDVPVTGISTYNVIPFEAGQYFNKIQCFCFEEQLLNPHEQVDMPVFFYIDPEFAEDPKMETVDTLTLSYTFFEAKEGLKLPVPSFIRK